MVSGNPWGIMVKDLSAWPDASLGDIMPTNVAVCQNSNGNLTWDQSEYSHYVLFIFRVEIDPEEAALTHFIARQLSS